MSKNTFHVSAIWNHRQETTANLAGGLLATLDAVTGICPYCENWNVQDWSRPGYGPYEMLLHTVPLSEVRDRLEDYVRHGVCREDDGEPDPLGGYRLDIKNGEIFIPRQVWVGCHGAYPINNWRNSAASFQTPYDTVPAPEIIRYSVIHRLINAYVSIWKPRYAVATVSDLFPYNRGARGVFNIAWMTYLSAPLARRVLPPQNIGVEWSADGGVLLIATDETFEVSNPGHMRAARAIEEAMAPLNRKFSRSSLPKL